MSKPILIGLAPNNFPGDAFLALLNLFWPFSWKKGKAIAVLENQFKKLFAVPYAFSFNSGRSALQMGLKALNLPKGSEVLLQGFSCVVVANSIRFAGLKPVFVDINQNSFSIDIDDLQKKITPETKAIILQNLFGIPDKVDKIQILAKKHRLMIVEDCAQALGATYRGKKLGQFGKFAFFSFGRDKVISSTFGGMLITKDKNLANNIKKNYQQLEFPNRFWIFKQLLHPIIFSLIVSTYFYLSIGKFSLGKIILFGLQKMKLLDFPVKKEEKEGKSITDYPKRLPNALAELALEQIKKLNKFNKKRIKIAQYYFKHLKNKKSLQLFKLNQLKEGIYLRFPVIADSPKKLIEFCKKRKIILGNWYDNVIAPKGTNLKKVGYKPGSCPRAEALCQNIINLPTSPKMSIIDAKRVINCLRDFYEN